MTTPNMNYTFIMGIKVKRKTGKKKKKNLLQKDKEITRSKIEMVPVQIITQEFSNQYCAKRNGHCTRCSVQFL